MALVLTAGTLLNASSGLLFVALGLFCLYVARGQARPILIGLLAIGYGGSFATTNLWPSEERMPLAPLASLAISTALVTGSVMAIAIRSTLAAGRGRALAILGVALAALFALAFRSFVEDARSTERPTAIATQAPWEAVALFALLAAFVVQLCLLVGACALAYPRAPPTERRSLAVLAIVFGAWPIYFLPILLVDGSALGNVFLLAAAVLSACVWLGAQASGDPKPARAALFGLLGLGLAGSVAGALLGASGAEDYGTPGAVRTLMVALLAFAILRHDLLGVRLPRFAVSRGPLAAGALASLFIVAEIAENFIDTKYGLVVGGIVAGAVIFVASPLQRALEGRSGAAPLAADDERLAVFRDAARRYVRDGAVPRDEELRLARLARHLGIPHEEAARIRHEVEDEEGVASRE